MDYVARAKALLIGKARTGALLVLPLAAAVHQAQAVTLTLPSANFGCFIRTGGTCSGGVSTLSAQGGLAGLSFYLTSPAVLTLQGNSSPQDINFQTSGGQITGTSGGSLSAGTPIPFAYDFTISTSSGASLSSWYLEYQMYDYHDGEFVITDSQISGSSTGTFSGSFTDPLSGPIAQGDDVLINAVIDFYGTSGGSVDVTVPSDSSLDFGGQPLASPEPSTESLGALGLAAAGIWRNVRRKRKA